MLVAASLAASLVVTVGEEAGASASGRVPRNFEPASASFVSGYVGFVLGTAPCPHAPCTSLVAAHDGGQSWVGLPAPRAPVEEVNPGSALAVGQVTYANARDGWAWGPALRYTQDGGLTWGKPVLPLPPGRGPADLLSLEASGGYAYAFVARSPYQGGAVPTTWLERTAVGKGSRRPLTSISGRLSWMSWYGRTGWG